MSKYLFKLSILFLLSFSIACATIGSYKGELREMGYEPFEVPRNFNGEGTIFRIDDGIEILWRDPKSCLSPDLIERVCGDASVRSSTEEVQTSINLMNFVEDSEKAALGIGGKNIKKVRLIFSGAFIRQIPVGNVVDLLRRNKMSDTCAEDLLHKDHYLIVEILGVEKMVYEFIQEKEMKFGLDKDFVLNKLGIKAGIEYKIERDFQLVIDFPCYIGYKAVKFYEYTEKGPKEKKIIQYTGHELPQKNMQVRKEISEEEPRIPR